MTGLSRLEDRLGYQFRDSELLKMALTHSSAGAAHYQRLEFLGDRVFGLLVAEKLYALHPSEPEGHLSRRHTGLVRAETLARAARKLDLGTFMLLSESERAAGGPENENILSDIMEAVAGALYLDGGLDATRTALLPLLESDFNTMQEPPRDPKTSLQEWAQGRGLGLPVYSVAERTGPDHAPQFRISVTVTGYPPVEGHGTSKRAAEKAAAEALLAQLEQTS